MFKKKGNSHAISTDRFEVSFRGCDSLIYTERSADGSQRTITVFAEMLFGRVNRSISVGTHFPWRYDPPYECDVITEDRKEQILKNITGALDFLGITYELCA